MIPAAFCWHESLPLTPNGKVDRTRLTASVPGTAAGAAPALPALDAAPSSELERQVAGLWAKVLRMADVGVTSNLYDLGGDSLAAARILTGVRKQFGVTITLDRLPEVDSVRAMAAQIGAARSGEMNAT